MINPIIDHQLIQFATASSIIFLNIIPFVTMSVLNICIYRVSLSLPYKKFNGLYPPPPLLKKIHVLRVFYHFSLFFIVKIYKKHSIHKY